MISGFVLQQPEATLVTAGIRQFTKHAANEGAQLRTGQRYVIVASFAFDAKRAAYQYELWYDAWASHYTLPALTELPTGVAVGTAVFSGCAGIERTWRYISWRDAVTEEWIDDKQFAIRWRDPQRFAAPVVLPANSYEKFGSVLQLSSELQSKCSTADVLPALSIPRYAPDTIK